MEYQAKVLTHQQINKDRYLLELEERQLTRNAYPGQFVELVCSKTKAPFLRRPFSIHDIQISKNSFTIYYQVIGEGTELLTNVSPGDSLSALGPLGEGFTLPKGKELVLIGGGMGIAPLLFLAKELVKLDNSLTVILGAQDEYGIFCQKEFLKLTSQVYVATEDGSLGTKGTVTPHVEEMLSDVRFSQGYACGPVPMLNKLKEMFTASNIPLQISIESRMACGFGVCLGCAVSKADESGYVKVCTDGPVFWSSEVKL